MRAIHILRGLLECYSNIFDTDETDAIYEAIEAIATKDRMGYEHGDVIEAVVNSNISDYYKHKIIAIVPNTGSSSFYHAVCSVVGSSMSDYDICATVKTLCRKEARD